MQKIVHARDWSRLAGILVLSVTVALVATGCGISLGHDSDNNCGDCSAKDALSEGMTVFGDGKAMYWLGREFEGVKPNWGIAAASHEVDPTSGRETPLTSVQYNGWQGCSGDCRVEVLTYRDFHPENDAGHEVARVRTPTGQIVILDAQGPPPPRQVLARMVKALRPVTQADVDRATSLGYDFGS